MDKKEFDRLTDNMLVMFLGRPLNFRHEHTDWDRLEKVLTSSDNIVLTETMSFYAHGKAHSCWLTAFKSIEEFEEEIAKYLSDGYAVFVNKAYQGPCSYYNSRLITSIAKVKIP